jgi:peptide/nickel transport system permease protein
MQRWRYLLGRIVWSFFTMLFVLFLNFFLFRILPGDPARAGIRDPRLTVEAQETIRVRFGLDKPVMNCFESLNPLRLGDCFINPLDTQFVIYIGNLLQGELGMSYAYSNTEVRDLLATNLYNTVLLIGVGQILAIMLGMALGILAAWKSRTALDYFALLFSLLAWSLPTFWLGIILLFWGSRDFGLPVSGKGTIGLDADLWGQISDLLRHMLLPTLTYTIVFLGEYMLIMRSTLLDVLSQDYILTAKAKGLSSFQVLKDHALQNAMLPMVTLIALNLGFTVAGAIQIESVFSWPGLGLLIADSVDRRDYPVLQGAFLLIAVTVILANLIADLTYSVLDPRVEVNG